MSEFLAVLDTEDTRTGCIASVEATTLAAEKRPKADVQWHDRSMTALLDTGAAICCMSREFYEGLTTYDVAHEMVEANVTNIVAVGGGRVQLHAAVLLKFKINGMPFKWPVGVFDGLSIDFLIGQSLLRKYGAVIDCEIDENLRFKYLSAMNLAAGQVKKRHEISEYSIDEVTVETTGSHRDGICYVDSVVDGVIPGVYDITDGKVRVRVKNDSHLPRHVEEGVLTSIEPLNEDDVLRTHQILHWQSEPPEVSCVSEGKSDTSVLSDDLKSMLWDLVKKLDGKSDDDDDVNPSEFKNDAERDEFFGMLCDKYAAFAAHPYDLGRTDVVPHKLLRRHDEPVFRKQFPIPKAHEEFINKSVDELLKLRRIKPDYKSRYNSAIFAVKKPHGGGLRLVQDLRAINKSIHDDYHSFMSVGECLDRLGGTNAKLLSALDLQNAYWQMTLDPDSQELTAFTVPGRGKFVWTVSTMGLKSSPAAFSRLMEYIFKGMKNVICYLDDVILGNACFRDHFNDVKECLQRLITHNLKLNPKKTMFCKKRMPYLGYEISCDGIKPGREKVKAIAEMKEPTTTEGILEFVGLANYFRSFVKDFS
ncbi:MAG: reverse transcriptase family protein, partial [Pseudomonadota bacterium]